MIEGFLVVDICAYEIVDCVYGAGGWECALFLEEHVEMIVYSLKNILLWTFTDFLNVIIIY